jgi:cytochrome c5
MSGSHEKLPKLFWIQIILVLIVGTLYLLAPKADKHHSDGSSESSMKTAAETLAPVGAVAVKSDDNASTGAARSAEALYKETCQTCHATGIANAPKLDDKAAWEPRVANGLDGLLKTAINGKGAMPARGGNPTISDEEMKSVILYMTGKAGFDLAADSDTASSTQNEAPPPEVKEPEAPVLAKEPEAPKAVEVPAAPVAPATPAAPVTEAVIAAPAIPAAAPMPAAATAVVDTAAGEKVYKSSCFACHDAGVAGSPKIADAAAWVSRIATGSDALYNSALNGKGVMPPKGGNMGLADADVKAAVDYMVNQSK